MVQRFNMTSQIAIVFPIFDLAIGHHFLDLLLFFIDGARYSCRELYYIYVVPGALYVAGTGMVVMPPISGTPAVPYGLDAY
mgnify:CR=1 FL=1